jgi:uncharacterized protein YukE
MSSTIIDHTANQMQSGFSLKLGNSYITSDQSVTKIVEEHSKLQEDGKTIIQTFTGDNHVTYKTDENGHTQALEGQKDILLEIGDHIDQQAVTDALNHVTQAERVLNPLGLAVLVKQATDPKELTQV